MKEVRTRIVAVAVFMMVLLFGILGIQGQITGKASDATINLTISPNVRINFTVDSIDFGYGAVTGENATIDSTGNVAGGNWTPVNQGFIIENAGGLNITLQLKGDKNASEFIGGTNPGFRYNVTDAEAGSCNSTEVNLGQWYEMNTTGEGTEVCQIFSNIDSHDLIRVDIQLVIPSDSDKGPLQNTITATGTAI